MTVYSPAQIYNFINQVHKGKTGRNIQAIPATVFTAIVLKESGGNSSALNVNTDGSRDRGLWQWNDKAWPSITDAQAFDPIKSTELVYQHTDGFNINKANPWVIGSSRGNTLRTEFTKSENTQQALATAASAVYASGHNVSVYDDGPSELLDKVRNTLDVIQRETGVAGGSGNAWVPSPRFPNPLDTIGAAVDTAVEGATDIADGVGTGIEAVGSFFATLLNPNLWKRIGVASLGLVIVLVAVILYNQEAITGAIGTVK